MEEFEDDDMGQQAFVIKKNVADIQSGDTLIQVLGTASEVNPSMEFKLSDDTGKFPVREVPHDIETIDEGGHYRVFGEVTVDGAGVQYIAAKIVQDMKDLDVDLYKKSLDLMEKIP